MESTTPFLLQVKAMIQAFVPPELAAIIMRYFTGPCSVGALLHLTTAKNKTKGDCFCIYPDLLHVARVSNKPTTQVCFFSTGHNSELRNLVVSEGAILSPESLVDCTSENTRILLNIQPFALEPEFLELVNDQKVAVGREYMFMLKTFIPDSKIGNVFEIYAASLWNVQDKWLVSAFFHRHVKTAFFIGGWTLAFRDKNDRVVGMVSVKTLLQTYRDNGEWIFKLSFSGQLD